MSEERHFAVGGRVNLYRRANSRFWQCQATIEGRSARVSSRQETLEAARRFAEEWYLARMRELDDDRAARSRVFRESGGAFAARSGYFAMPLRDKRTRILSAAIGLVSETGFREAQIAAIAARAGLAPATLYKHFPSRNALLVEVVTVVSQHEVNVVAGVAMGAGAPRAILRDCARTFASRAIRGRQLAHALVAESVDSEIEMERLRHRRSLMRVFETVIERGMRDGDFVEQTPEISSACIVGSLFEALSGPLARTPDLTEDQRLRQVDEIVDFCTRAVVRA